MSKEDDDAMESQAIQLVGNKAAEAQRLLFMIIGALEHWKACEQEMLMVRALAKDIDRIGRHCAERMMKMSMGQLEDAAATILAARAGAKAKPGDKS
jgi:hypothetical protein